VAGRRHADLAAAAALPMAEEGPAQSFTFAPVGHIESCFRRLRGIPRQGALAPATKARLVLQQGSVQACTADELERFSHLWVVFVFHDNKQPSDSKQRPGHQDYRAKIAPPKLYALPQLSLSLQLCLR
jgi:hypothetical protein